MLMPFIKKCCHCKEEFSSKSSFAKLCSRECHNKHMYIERIEKKCNQCNKKYFVEVRLKSSKFCSNKCSSDFIKQPKLKKKCLLCGTIYLVAKRHYESSKFCSNSCKCSTAGKKSSQKIHKKWEQETHQETKAIMKEAFEKFFDKTDGCWEWKGGKKNYGKKLPYGSFSFRDKRTNIAHRISYELYRGLIPKGLIVMHICDNPPCVNPDHLKVGTYLDNQKDKVRKGRGKVEKLSEEEVKEILSRFKMGVKGCRIAKDFGISQSTASSIKHRKLWAWVKID